MTPERWRELRAIFDRLAPLSEAERESALAALAQQDANLALEARSLLAAEGRDAGFLGSQPGSAPDRRGERIGPWELLSPLGEGGMGQVFLARRADQTFDKLVAVKFVHAELLSPLMRAQFTGERQALAALEHSGIARLLDGGESAAGEPYLVLEYVEGSSLLRFASEQRLGERARIELFLQVLAAVSYAHRHLVVHRDLKPSNILVTGEGEAKLLDFGVAKILATTDSGDSADSAGRGSATRTLLRALTPEYASPEQVLGGPTTTATDVYALGVVLFELLTGRRPYRVATGAPEEWAEAALHQEIGRVPELSRDLEAVVQLALRKSPGDRYPTADALADDLRRVLDGRPVTARPASAAGRALKFVRRHRVTVGLATAALLAIVATALAALAQAAEARRERDMAERRFAQVRELAGVFLFDVHDAIAPLAGSTDARALLLGTGLRYLDLLAAEAADDLGLMREVAGGYERLGKLQGAIVLPNLGKSQDALASQEKALRIRDRLATASPRDPGLALELARSELALGQALVRLGRVKEAPAYSARAVAELERVAVLEPESAEATRERGETLAAHGYLVAAAGDIAAAEPIMARAVAVLEAIRATRVDDIPIGTALSMALFRQAQIRAERGGQPATAEAIAILARALVIDRELIARAPDDPGLRRRLESDLAKRAQLLADGGDHEAALASFAEVLSLTEQDRARDPSDALAKRNLCIARNRSARSLLALGRSTEARALVAPAVSDLTAMLSGDPGNLFLEFSLAEATLRLGQAQLQLVADTAAATEPPPSLRQLARANVTAAVARLSPLVENGSLSGSDADLLEEARRELAAFNVAPGKEKSSQ